MSNHNYYQELNVTTDATEQEIRASYRKLALENHPDRNKDNSHSVDRMKSINEAYAVLSDPDKRRQYDLLYKKYGDNARHQFRQNFSDQEIFRGSDIQQIFEEMARSFGIRGFNDIYKDVYDRGNVRFEFQQTKMFGQGGVFNKKLGADGTGKKGQRLMGAFTQKVLGTLTGILLPQRGGDLHGVIKLHPALANQGGPYAYFHQAREKKLVVNIPKGIRDGQLIRLSGMGNEGTHGAGAGDLLLKVKIRTSFVKKIRDIIRLDR